jgi:hypothetical protein
MSGVRLMQRRGRRNGQSGSVARSSYLLPVVLLFGVGSFLMGKEILDTTLPTTRLLSPTQSFSSFSSSPLLGANTNDASPANNDASPANDVEWWKADKPLLKNWPPLATRNDIHPILEQLGFRHGIEVA